MSAATQLPASQASARDCDGAPFGNRDGFRYNVYSDGSWYAWVPLWAPK